jgi:threonine dehydratase
VSIDRCDVERAAQRISGRVRRTPVLDAGASLFGTPTILKLELLQITGSFKVRGAFNRLLDAPRSPAGVIAASGGNHGLGVAHAAAALGLRAEVFVPVSSPPVKVERLRGLGAEVTVTGAFYADAYQASVARARATGALVVHAYDQPEVAAGQGTVALELEEQAGALDTVLVGVGGGGLVAGIAAALEDRCHVVAVEPARIPTLHHALDADMPVDVPVSGVAADSLGARRIGQVCLTIARRTKMRSVLVGDDAIVAARRLLWEEFRVTAEHGGATALAALLSGAYTPSAGERVAVVVSGGNTDPCTLQPSPPPDVRDGST